jgi:hypothetical protein
VKFLVWFLPELILVILGTSAECGIKMKDQPNLLHRNGVNEPRLSFFAISAMFESVEI